MDLVRSEITLMPSNTLQNAKLFSELKAIERNGLSVSECEHINVSENESLITEGISEHVQSSADADNLLQNGILVETNKGVVCMSLKDVLSSNLNLSVEDFKKVAAQLLSQEESIPVSKINSTRNEIKPKLEVYEKEHNVGKDNPSSSLIMSQNYSCVDLKFELPMPIIKSLIIPRVVGRVSSNNYTRVVELSKEVLSVDSVLSNNLQSNERNVPFTSLVEINQSHSDSCVTSETVDTSEENELQIKNDVANITVKRRGGWPKGRKRKPELLNLPPKAPKTSYNIFLNERRKLYKDKLAFHEITRVVGNQWSNLTAEEKLPYVERAEEDKKRYREELRIYRQSDAYKLYLARKRKKRTMDNLMSESDMDGTDDIDDEDNDMLYCDTCDQWFYNLHNKREHFLSRQHKILVAGDITRKLANSDSENKSQGSSMSFCTSLDESSMDGTVMEPNSMRIYTKRNYSESEHVYDNMVRLIGSVTSVYNLNILLHCKEREKEIHVLDARLKDSILKQNEYLSLLNLLKEKTNILRSKLSELKQQEFNLEQQLYKLWNVPSLFVINNNEFVNNV